MTSANLLQVARARETTLGVAAPSPYSKAFLTAESFDVDRAYERSETITGDRFVAEYIPVGVSVAADAPFEIAMGYADPWFELMLMSQFAATVEAFNVTADQNITNVVASTDAYTAAGAWAQGMLIRASGFTNAANNLRFRAQAGSGAGTCVSPDGRVDEAAPPAGARLKMVGFEGAAGDLTLTSAGIASTSLDFTTLGLQPGMQIWFPTEADGAAAVNCAQIAGVDGQPATIQSIAANLLTLTDKPAAWATAALSGKQLRVFTPDILTPGTSIISDTFQKRFTGQSGGSYYKYVGVAANTWQMNLEPKKVATAQASLLGFTGGIASPALDANPLTPIVGKVMNTSTGIARIAEAGSDIAAGAGFASLNIQMTNNLKPIEEIGSEAAVDYDLGDFEVTISSRNRFKTAALYHKFLNGVQGALMVPFKRGAQGFTMRFHELTYTAGKVPTPGRNQQVYAQMEARAVISPTYAKPVVVCRFTELA